MLKNMFELRKHIGTVSIEKYFPKKNTNEGTNKIQIQIEWLKKSGKP